MPLTAKQKRREVAESGLPEMPLKTLEDYEKYNKKRKELGLPVIPAPLDLHPKTKVKFLRRDGHTHKIRLKLRNDKIDFDQWVEHGKVYDIPNMAIRKYQDLGIPQYMDLKKPNGESETVFSHMDPRFAFQVVFED